ncbi:response regulator [Methylophaga sp.]|uniref:response regulator n=1 Tax=Methylophaga sp. TaxID=2024840 RepID=UPI003F6A3652
MEKNNSLTTKQVADLFNVTIRAVQLWADKGVITVSRTPGGHRRIAKEELSKIRDHLHQEPSSVSSSGNIDFDTNNHLRILLVEDDTYMLSLYESVISEWQSPPVRVITANDGYQALIEVGKAAFDLIITDIKMPNIDGARMIKIIRQNSGDEAPRIAVVTSLTSTELRENYELPADVAIFEKPVSYAQLHRIASEIYKKKYNNIL